MKKLILIIVAVMMAVTTMATSLTDGLVGYWPFDGDAKDYSGNGNHGTTHGVTQTTDRHGKAYSAYHFNGSSYISVAANGQLNAIGDFTVATWINADAWHTYWIPIVCKGGQFKLELINENCPTITSMWESGEYDNSFIGYDDNYKSIFGAGCLLCTSHRIPLKEWLHVAVSRSGKTIRAYINGALVDSGMARNAYEMNSSAMDIGRDLPGSVEYLYGRIDDMYLYNRALSASEVKALYNGMLKVFTVAFNANDGEGTMSSLSALSGTTKSLPTNMFHRDGYVFKGWAKSTEHAANGIVDYTDEQEITVDSDLTLYAVWANPALALTAESADWSLGSITLRCEDSDTSGTAHKYTLKYKNASGVWEEVDGAKNKLATKGQDASGQEVWVAKLTDPTFWSRLGGLPPVEYRVKDENGRASEGCVTRNRFLLSVGYSKFLTKNTPKRGHYNDASEIKSLCVNRGEFLPENARFRSNADATTEKVRGEMSYFATRTKPGDVFVFYIATHGGGYDSKHNASLATYDGGYQVKDLLDDVRAFPSGVAVVNIIMSCHSFALTGSVNASERINQWLVACGFGQCLGNVAWVTSCDAQQSSYTYLDEDHSRFGQSFIVNGFGQGCADMKLYGTEYGGGDKDGFITIGELGRYSKEFFKGLSEDMPSSVQLENDGLIDRIVLGRRTGDVAWSCPETPSSINASQGDMKIDISWAGVGNATSYRIYRYPLDLPSEFKWVGISGESRYKDETATLKKEYGYRIRAVNPIGVSDLSSVAIGSRGTSKFIEFLNSFFGITTASADEYDAMEKTTAANGCRTVGECYALGIDPEDPNDDLKITDFKMEDGKPVITLNHTEDGSGNSFLPRVKTLGKKSLMDADWVDITDIDQSGYRFFKVAVPIYDDDGGSGDDGEGNSGYINLDDFVIEQGVLRRYGGEAVNVVIPSCVTNIGEAAFAGNTNLVRVTIPDSVANVGDYAFGFCTELATVSLPASLEGSISDSVFHGCPEGLRIVYRSASAGARSINVNFTDGNALDGVNCAEELVGAEGYAVPCSVWDNVVGTNSVNLVRIYKGSSGDFAGAADVSLEIAGSRGYWNCHDLASSNSLLYAYVDDIVGSACPTLTVSNIPFENCRVVIYASTDSPNAKFGHYTINGLNVTGNGSAYGTESWGDAGPWYSAQPLAQGVNYVVSPVIALGKGGELSIATHNARGATIVDNTRGTIAAIQIVETDDAPMSRTVTFDLGEHGSRIGGGELVQTVAEGAAAIAPQVAVTNGLTLIGWDADFSFVTNDLTVTARYAVNKYYGSRDSDENPFNPVLAITEGFTGLSGGWNLLNGEFWLNMNGSGVSADGKTLAIGDAGLELGFTRPFTNITVVVECEHIAASDGMRGLFSVETTEYKNRVGVSVETDGTVSGYYNTVDDNETSVTPYSEGLTYGMKLPLDGNKTYLAFHYDRRRANSRGNGVSVYCISQGVSTRCYYGFKLKYAIDDVVGVCVGGAYGSVYAPMTGMTICSLAVFEGDISGGALNLGDGAVVVMPDYSAPSAN